MKSRCLILPACVFVTGIGILAYFTWNVPPPVPDFLFMAFGLFCGIWGRLRWDESRKKSS